MLVDRGCGNNSGRRIGWSEEDSWTSGTIAGGASIPTTRIWGAPQCLQNGTPSSTASPHFAQERSTGLQGTAALRVEARKVNAARGFFSAEKRGSHRVPPAMIVG